MLVLGDFKTHTAFQLAVCCCDRHPGRKQLGKEKVYSSLQCTVHHRVNPGGNSKTNLETEADAEAMQECFTSLVLMICSPCFLIQPRTTGPRVTEPTVGCPPPPRSKYELVYHQISTWCSQPAHPPGQQYQSPATAHLPLHLQCIGSGLLYKWNNK